MSRDCAGDCHSRKGGAPGASCTTRAAEIAAAGSSPLCSSRDEQLHEDLRLDVATHRPDDLGQRAVGTSDDRRRQRVGGPAPRPVFGGVSGLEGEADTAIVEEDPSVTGDQMRAEIERVGLGEGDPETVGVDRAQVSGVSVRKHAGPGAGPFFVGLGRDCLRRIDGRRSGLEPLG